MKTIEQLELELSARDEEIKRLREAGDRMKSELKEFQCNARDDEERDIIKAAILQWDTALNPNSGVKQAFPGGRF